MEVSLGQAVMNEIPAELQQDLSNPTLVNSWRHPVGFI
jgi:hypothetical protein